MAGKFNYVIEGEDSEIYIQKYTFLPSGERGKREGFRQLAFFPETTVVKIIAPEMMVAKDEKLDKKMMKKMIKMLLFNRSTERSLKSEKGKKAE